MGSEMCIRDRFPDIAGGRNSCRLVREGVSSLGEGSQCTDIQCCIALSLVYSDSSIGKGKSTGRNV